MLRYLLVKKVFGVIKTVSGIRCLRNVQQMWKQKRAEGRGEQKMAPVKVDGDPRKRFLHDMAFYFKILCV